MSDFGNVSMMVRRLKWEGINDLHAKDGMDSSGLGCYRLQGEVRQGKHVRIEAAKGGDVSIQLLVGDALERLRELPDESVHCCVTSPPYWGLRAYGGDTGMIGLKPTFDDHLANLVAVFREVRRVLRSDGTLWLNYGDAYASHDPGGYRQGEFLNPGGRPPKKGQARNRAGMYRPMGLKPKDLMMMPARVAMALQADGWWLRSEIVWHKPNPMPESAQDRPTSAHEKLFLMTKAPRYYWDAEAVRQQNTPGTLDRAQYPKRGIPRRDASVSDSGLAAHAARNNGKQRGHVPPARRLQRPVGCYAESRAASGWRQPPQRLEHRYACVPWRSLRHLSAGVGRAVHQGGHQREGCVRGVRGAVAAEEWLRSD